MSRARRTAVSCNVRVSSGIGGGVSSTDTRGLGDSFLTHGRQFRRNALRFAFATLHVLFGDKTLRFSVNHGFTLATNTDVFGFECFAGLTLNFTTRKLSFMLDTFLANFGVLNFFECLSFRF